MPDIWDGVGERYGNGASARSGPAGPVCSEDREVLRELGKRKREAAAQPNMERNKTLWRATNDLRMITPPVFIDEVCWNEADPYGETIPRCRDPWLQRLERSMRRELFLLEHAPVNWVVSDTVECPVVACDSGFGIDEDVRVAVTDPDNEIVSRHFHLLISGPEDIGKLTEPAIRVDPEQTQQNLAVLQEIFSGIMDVRLTGTRGLWFTPWDYLIRVTGIEDTLANLVLEPEFVDALVSRYVDMAMLRMESYTKLGLWASNNGNVRVGSGGYGYCSDLPEFEDLRASAPTRAMWGCGNAQIFSEVSPRMHWEFSLKHEMRWLERFGLVYYGCCEPLHTKLDILGRIPNLRKISMSPWANLELAAEACGGRYVLSCKPNPAIFAAPTWDSDAARSDIARILRQTRDCNIEIIMKDISTISRDPRRLWEWAKIAGEMTK